MRGLVIVEHQVDCVRRGTDEDDFEARVIQCVGIIKGPYEVDVAGEVHDEVEKLRLE